jgi:hypothetical protein
LPRRSQLRVSNLNQFLSIQYSNLMKNDYPKFNFKIIFLLLRTELEFKSHSLRIECFLSFCYSLLESTKGCKTLTYFCWNMQINQMEMNNNCLLLSLLYRANIKYHLSLYKLKIIKTIIEVFDCFLYRFTSYS